AIAFRARDAAAVVDHQFAIVPADQLRQRGRQPKARMEAELGEIGREARLRPCEAKIRRDREPRAAADRGAMDGSNDRLLVAEDAHRLHIEMVDRQICGRIIFRARLLLLPCRITKIGSGAERLALRGEHGSADLDVAVELFQRIRDLVDQGDVEEVEWRPSGLDPADMVMSLAAGVRVCRHERSSLNYRNPSPRAMMPRNTSVVPPWMVNFGAVLIANASCASNVSRLPAFSSTKAASSRTRCGNCCSHTVPMSLTMEASTTGSLPA